MPRLVVMGVPVQDQSKALTFYTEVLGFRVDVQVPLGEHQLIMLVSAEDPDGPRLMLEPMAMPFTEDYQFHLRQAGMQAATFGVDDCAAEAERLTRLGVRVVVPPTDLGATITMMIDDTVGNLIALAQLKS